MDTARELGSTTAATSLAKRIDLASGAAAVGLVAAVGGTLAMALGATHMLSNASMPDIIQIVGWLVH